MWNHPSMHPSLIDGLRWYIHLPNDAEPGLAVDHVFAESTSASRKKNHASLESSRLKTSMTTRTTRLCLACHGILWRVAFWSIGLIVTVLAGLRPYLPWLLDDVNHPDFDESSRWPRRLLDVRTMTSHKWQPGNQYGGVSEPRYSVLSYTWGRWRIRDRDSTLHSLRIKGVPWEIPRVDPIHFTTEQFMHVLQVIADATMVYATSDGHLTSASGEGPRFVWVDIACIPQFQRSAIAASEVGRQARIFGGASSPSIWLTTADSADLNELYEGYQSRLFFGDDHTHDVIENFKTWCKLLDDPWFQSMWTLQESYIQKEASIVTSTGSCTLGLYDLRILPEDFDRSKKIHSDVKHDFALYRGRWFRMGLHEATPMKVLACSRFRTCEFELDRVYGIMQIFGNTFRVGKARVETEKGRAATRSYTLSQLEDELGGLVMERFPAMSQLFRHDEPPLAGRAWRICGRASVPSPLDDESKHFDHGPSMAEKIFSSAQPNLMFSTYIDGSITWATFQGRVCHLSRIIDCSRSVQLKDLQRNFRIYLDAGPDFEDFNRKRVGGLFAHFGREAHKVLTVLLLSSRVITHTSLPRLETGFLLEGLILLSPGHEALAYHRTRRQWHSGLDSTGRKAWARVGVCHIKWSKDDWARESNKARPEIQTLLAKSDDWKYQEGIWG